MSSIIVHGIKYDALPMDVANYEEDGLYRFFNQKRKCLITEVIVHETVTRSALATVDVLKPTDPGHTGKITNPGGRNLGVHFIVGPEGKIYQHGDLADDLHWHASQHNNVSIGIETVSPYEPRFMPKDGPWTTVIDAPWAVGGKYVVPTKEQSEAVASILTFCTNPTETAPPELKVPRTWVGLRGTTMAFSVFEAAKKVSPGIYAHQYFHHGDGSWLVLYSWLRMEAQMDQETAYAETIRRATGVRGGVDLSDIFEQNPDIPLFSKEY